MTKAAAPSADPPALPGLDLKRALIAELCAAEAAFSTLAPERALHAGRVRLKRARALARIAMHAAPWTAGRLNILAREIMHRLSAARDLDALIGRASALQHGASRRARRGLDDLVDSLQQHRAGLGWPNLSQAAADVRGMIGLAKALPVLDTDDLRDGLERLDARAARALRRAEQNGSEANRHWWRKREKDRLYGHDVVCGAGLVLTTAPMRVRASARLCDALGEERDSRLLLASLDSELDLIAKPKRKKAVVRLLRKSVKRATKRADRQSRKRRWP